VQSGEYIPGSFRQRGRGLCLVSSLVGSGGQAECVAGADFYTFGNSHVSGVMRYHSMMMSGGCCIYGLSPWRMASVGLMHILSKIMVIP